MSTPRFTAPETPVTREEVYYDAILRGLNGDSPAPVIPTPVWRMEEYLAAIAEAASSGGGGSSLPAVTSADNGKVLAVKDGAWAADANVYIINERNAVADIGATEIMALASAGFVPVLKTVGNYYVYTYTSGEAYFIRTYYTDGNLYCQYVSVAPNKKVTRGIAIVLYSKPSDGIPETDLAQGVKDKLNKFVVTFTPTSPDFSGTMDKTPAEITAAYNAGQEIVFDIPSMNAKINATQFLAENNAIRAGGMVFYDVNSSPVIITVATDSLESIYHTQIFALTPAS